MVWQRPNQRLPDSEVERLADPGATVPPSRTVPASSVVAEATALTDIDRTRRERRLAGRSAIRAAMRRGLREAGWCRRTARGEHLARTLARASGNSDPTG